MDRIDEDILGALMDGKPKDFDQLLRAVDISHNTLRLHLDYLVEEALMRREKTRGGGRGRPIFTYSLASAGRGSASTSPSALGDTVSLPFRRLEQVCRFEKGGFCKKVRNPCKAQNCPQINK
jgi:predicted ArsR family transcriptional regulator